MDLKIAENLKILRLKNKMTLEELAQAIDVSRQSVSKWESGANFPDINKCVKLARLFNISLDALVNIPLTSAECEESVDGKYMFGLTRLEANGSIKLPKKAIEVFGITPSDALIVFGDVKQGIAITKCEKNDFMG